ncbi:MAG: VWA domain-containing protein [Pirellulaceae bacterium]
MMLEAFGNFHFIRPWWLLFLPVVVGVWWLWRRHCDPLRAWRAQMDPDLLRALTVNQDASHRGSTRWWLLGWLLATVAIAGPAWRLEPSPFADDVSPLIILLKAGGGMDRIDMPTSPLSRAKLKISDLADLRKGEPLGLIAYAGSAHLVLPPTRDTSVVAQMAAEISPEVMPVPGDRLDLALRKAEEVLTSGESGGSILVIADSVQGETEPIVQAWQQKKFPVQFLALGEPDSPETESVEDAAGTLRATVRQLTADDEDVSRLAQAAKSYGIFGVGGESSRWQESGYWLVPLLAILTLLSLRREATVTPETRS